MSDDMNPLDEMLDLAFTLTNSSFKYYDKAAKKAKMAEVKALLSVIAESETNLLIKLRHMMITGIVDELEELKRADDRDEIPDETPFDPSRAKSDPRIFVCNKALKKEVSGYTFFLTLAARANSTLVSRLFEYLAHLKMRQIKRIRRICTTF
ncbi:MAG: hypothetical protein ACTSU3_07455 [Candidatus Thorarchaeota archaeon]